MKLIEVYITAINPMTGKRWRGSIPELEVIAHAQIDDCFYDTLNQYVWLLSIEKKKGKVFHHVYRYVCIHGKHKKIKLREQVLMLAGVKRPSKCHTIDYRDGNCFNCQWDNLKFLSPHQRAIIGGHALKKMYELKK